MGCATTDKLFNLSEPACFTKWRRYSISYCCGVSGGEESDLKGRQREYSIQTSLVHTHSSTRPDTASQQHQITAPWILHCHVHFTSDQKQNTEKLSHLSKVTKPHAKPSLLTPPLQDASRCKQELQRPVVGSYTQHGGRNKARPVREGAGATDYTHKD